MAKAIRYVRVVIINFSCAFFVTLVKLFLRVNSSLSGVVYFVGKFFARGVEILFFPTKILVGTTG